MPTVEFQLDEAGNPILPSGATELPGRSTRLQDIRITPTHDELSLHPRAVWNHWKRHMLWDHRTYYGLLELLCGGALVLCISGYNEGNGWGWEHLLQRATQAFIILAGIVPIHWYSNQRLSTHVLTRSLSHLVVLSSLAVFTLALQIVTILPSPCEKAGGHWCHSDTSALVDIVVFCTIPILVVAAFVIWKVARTPPPRDPILAELPSTHDDEDVDDEATRAWASTNVADGIEDDSLEPQGQSLGTTKTYKSPADIIMTVTTNENATGNGGSSPKFSMKFTKSLSEWRIYLGVAVFFVAFTLLFGIICLSFLKPKEEPLMFGLDIVSILLSLGTFAALCFMIQRAKDQKYGDHPFDPNYADVLYTFGIAVLFGLSALCQLKELPKRCYSGPNADFKSLGPSVCGVITTMGVFSGLGIITMLLTSILVTIAVRRAIAASKLPPPIFPSGVEPAVMSWLDRSDDPFGATGRGVPRRQDSSNNV